MRKWGVNAAVPGVNVKRSAVFGVEFLVFAIVIAQDIFSALTVTETQKNILIAHGQKVRAIAVRITAGIKGIVLVFLTVFL